MQRRWLWPLRAAWAAAAYAGRCGAVKGGEGRCSWAPAGILYSDMPRGEMTDTVTFTDRKNGLVCEMQFGKVMYCTSSFA